jgi:hypothetical protein
MAKRLLAVAALVGLAGCTHSSGVLPLGNGEFTVTVKTDIPSGGIPAGQRRGVEEAEQYCAQQARRMEPGPVGIAPQTLRSYAVFTMRFRCT